MLPTPHSPHKMTTYTCLTHNTHGLNDPVKRKVAFSYYKQQADILFFQETHFSRANHPTFFHSSYQRSYFSLAENKTKGTAILLKNTFPFPPTATKIDPDSRYTIVSGKLADKPLTLISVYAPNSGHATFFKDLARALEQFADTYIILGGDRNMVFDPQQDRYPSHP